MLYILTEMNDKELAFCQQAVKNFKRLENVTLNGNQYRLVSPYENNHAAIMYTDNSKQKAVLFAFDIHPRYGEQTYPVRLDGLDADKKYKVEEINLIPGTSSSIEANGKTFSGDYLMKVGIPVFSTKENNSHVLEITAQ